MSAMNRLSRKAGACFRFDLATRKHQNYSTTITDQEAGGEDESSYLEDEGFEKMAFIPQPRQWKRFRRDELFRNAVMNPRYQKMPVNQDWNAVWPAARSFAPSVVPLPVYMGGANIKDKPRIGKFNNPELMKIPNFLHLAPPNVKKQCQALKRFCSPWPKGLETEEKIEKHFPLEVITSDYCHASPTIRDYRARTVSLKFKLSSLELDDHSRDKMIRLLDTRYDPETDMVTITTEACPLKQQNFDYALYQLTACYYESWKTEPWEENKEPQDWEKFYWDKSSSKRKILELLKHFDPESKEEIIEKKSQVIEEYSKAVADIVRKEENDDLVDNYGRSVTKLLFN